MVSNEERKYLKFKKAFWVQKKDLMFVMYVILAHQMKEKLNFEVQKQSCKNNPCYNIYSHGIINRFKSYSKKMSLNEKTER